MEIRGAEREVLCGSGGDEHSMNGSKRTMISRSPTAQSQQFPDHVFPFLGTVTHLLYGYVVRWEAMNEGHQSHHLGASVVVLFIQEIMKFLPLNMVRHRSQAQLLCVCVE